jgi:hypothetical protein
VSECNTIWAKEGIKEPVDPKTKNSCLSDRLNNSQRC